MADPESAGIHESTPDDEGALEVADLDVSGKQTEEHGKHEVVYVVDAGNQHQEAREAAEVSQQGEAVVPGETANNDRVDLSGNSEEPTPQEDMSKGDAIPLPSSPEKARLDAAKKLTPSKGAVVATKDKPGVSAKAVPAKSNGPPTPVVKKVINSGTFGAGAVRPAPAPKPPTTTGSSTLAKSTSTAPSAALKKSTAAPPTVSKPTTTMAGRSPPTTQNRRSSVIPPKNNAAPPAPKSRTSILSGLGSRMNPTDAAVNNANASVRAASPAPSITSQRSGTAPARPRASISDAVKRVPSSSRQSTIPPASAVPGRMSKPTSSISSIKEVKDDSKALEELQQKLKEATYNLSAKTEAIAALETQVEHLKSSLDAALADGDLKSSTVADLQKAKAASEVALAELEENFQTLQRKHDEGHSLLQTVHQDLEAAKAASADRSSYVQTLQTQIDALEQEVAATRDALEAVRASNESASSEAAAAAQIEHEALLKAKDDLDNIKEEAEALEASHAAALDEALGKLESAEARAAGVDALRQEVNELKAERADTANKISELEIEILELRETQENAEDEHSQALARIKKLEADLAVAVEATQQAIDDARAQEEEFSRQAEEVQRLHNEEVQNARDELAKVAASLEALQAQLADAHAAHEATKAESDLSSEDHARQLEEAEQLYLAKHNELVEEIKNISTELEEQESKYNAKVDAIKAEHDVLLQEAFERAKNEAGSLHGQDLQALRAESQAALEQLRAAHESTIDGLKAEHAAAVESHTKSLEKQISGQAIELRATQDDLSKAKAALEVSRSEVASLSAQLEDARAAFAAASASSDLAPEVDRLTKELTSLRDENTMLTDVLAVTKDSLSQLSANQSKELEEAAKGRAEEVTRLRAAHEEQISALSSQNRELSIKLSDLEGELATLRASIAAEPMAPSRGNGIGSSHGASPSVTKEELHRLHEAHNLKMHDLQAEHDRTIRALKAELEASQSKTDEMQQEIARKAMEIQYLEQEQEENQDHITRLQTDIEALSEQLPKT